MTISATNDPVVSCCAFTTLSLADSLAVFSRLGYRRVECFSEWVQSALDVSGRTDPQSYRDLAAQHGISLFSLHLPALGDEGGINGAVTAARVAAAAGMQVVYVRTRSWEALLRDGGALLPVLEELGLTAALEIHQNTPIDDIDRLRSALDVLGNPRVRGVLEVGHLWKVGQSWRQAWEAVGPERLSIVHLKDMKDGKSVPLGTGDCDVTGLLRHLADTGYGGDLVVELLLKEPYRSQTEQYLSEARRLITSSRAGAAKP